MKTDTNLQQDVMAELKWEPSVNGAQIGVEVEKGVVTLSGHVDSYAEKWNAESAAQRVPGVKGLAVDLDVILPGLSQRTDADIARTAENILQWSNYWPSDAVKVTVEGGWITLTGEVNWHFQKTSAFNAVRYLMGVKGVNDQVTIKHNTFLSNIRANLESAFERHGKSGISIDVVDHVVTLTGNVPTWSAWEQAGQSAWRTPGVHSVVNNIKISN